MESNMVLQTKNLTKTFKEKKAVDAVSMTIRKGEIYGFIGKNGAGKTTFMRMITGLAKPNEGEILLFASSQPEKQRKRIGSSIETPALYPNLTCYENLEATRRMLGITDKTSLEKSLHTVGLEQSRNKKAKHLSLGMKQRLEIAIVLLGSPDFLVLDEPMNGLDPEGIIEVRDLLLDLQKQKNMTILLSSHILGELSKIATNYGIINNGKLIEQFSKQELEQKCKTAIKIKVDKVKKASQILETVCGIKEYDVLDGNTIRIFAFADNPAYLNRELSQNGILVEEIKTVGEDLEDYFMELMGGKEND